jgi:hypothetical protein
MQIPPLAFGQSALQAAPAAKAADRSAGEPHAARNPSLTPFDKGVNRFPSPASQGRELKKQLKN